jgi:hypothetical protein
MALGVNSGIQESGIMHFRRDLVPYGNPELGNAYDLAYIKSSLSIWSFLHITCSP